MVAADDNIVLMRKTTARTPVVFRGTLRTSAAGTPVAGAIVALVDTLHAIRAASRSDERGRFELRSRGYGQFRLRIQRIGVRPYESALFELTGDTTAAIALNELPAVTLPRVTALAASACRDKSVAALNTWQLWEDVRTALLETSITYAEQRTKFKIARVKRVFDTQPTTMRTIAILEDTVSGAQPWTSFSPDILAQNGYVTFANDRLTFVSPDLDVMLSRSFENTHCFRPAILRDGALVGLEFEPAKSLKNRTDIAGAFWLDRATHELRQLNFHHTGLPMFTDDSIEGSVVEFAKFDGQRWFMPSWAIRAPVPLLRTDRTVAPAEQLRIFAEQIGAQLFRPLQWKLGGVAEQRGVVLVAYGARGNADTGAVWAASTGTIRIDVATRMNSPHTPPPLAGAQVRLLGSTRDRVTDGTGLALFDGLTPGEYRIEVSTTANLLLDDPPDTIDVRVEQGAIAKATALLRSPRELIRLRCGGDTVRQVAIEGTVIGNGVAARTATLALYDFGAFGAEHVEKVLGTFSANSKGHFVICVSRRYASNLLDLRAHAPGGGADSAIVHFHAGVNIQTVDLTLRTASGAKATEQHGAVPAVQRESIAADTGAIWMAPTGKITVDVSTKSPDGQVATPVDGAEVVLIGSRRQLVSGPTGVATFEQLSAGDYEISVTTISNRLLREPASVIVAHVGAASATSVSVPLRSPREIIRGMCGGSQYSEWTRTLVDPRVIVGTVLRDSVPFAGAYFTVLEEYPFTGEPSGRIDGVSKLRSDVDGRFVICTGLSVHPTAFDLQVSAPGGKAVSRRVQFAARDIMEVADIVLPSPRNP